MFFTLNLLVPDANKALINRVLDNHRLADVTKSGILVVQLIEDRRLSHAYYPREWTDNKTSRSQLFRYQPNFTKDKVRTVYKVPEVLQGISFRPTLEGAEVHSRGSYCQVVTGYNGECLRPYRRESNWLREEHYVHPTASIFSEPKLGLVRLDINAARKQGRLTLQRASLQMSDGMVTVTWEQLLYINDPSLATDELETLPPMLATWEAALGALYQRLECDAASCDGHFHLV